MPYPPPGVLLPALDVLSLETDRGLVLSDKGAGTVRTAGWRGPDDLEEWE